MPVHNTKRYYCGGCGCSVPMPGFCSDDCTQKTRASLGAGRERSRYDYWKVQVVSAGDAHDQMVKDIQRLQEYVGKPYVPPEAA